MVATFRRRWEGWALAVADELSQSDRRRAFAGEGGRQGQLDGLGTVIEREAPAGEGWSKADVHRARLMRLALRLCNGDRDAASDLAQQAIANACCRLGLDGDRDLWPYLRTSLLHLYIDRARLLKRELPLDALGEYRSRNGFLNGSGHEADSDRELRLSFLRKSVKSVLAEMPDSQVALLLLIYAEGHSLEEAGTRLGLSAEAVKQRLKRARERFRKTSLRLQVEFEL